MVRQFISRDGESKKMPTPEQLKSRFDGVMERLVSIRSRLTVLPADASAAVDTGDLEANCFRYQERISQLLDLPAAPEINAELGRLLVAIRVSVQEIEACCSGLNGPLDRLITAVYEHLPEDPECADDAG
ncbi:MAG TPA: hypothetical protein VF139_10205 [Candidatus Polarisedimenticolaceae bacterium]